MTQPPLSLTIEDHVALADLVCRYAALVDDRQPEAVAELFTRDCVLAVPDPPAHLDPVRVQTGQAAVARTIRELAPLRLTVHEILGQVIEPTEKSEPADVARGRVTGVAHHLTSDGASTSDLVWHLHYLDRYRRTAAGWRFSRRDLHLDFVETRPVRLARDSRG